MDIVPLPPEGAAVRRYVAELWVPYHRTLESAVDAHSLADDEDAVVDAETEFRLDLLESDGYHLWVAVDGEGVVDVGAGEGELAGFLTAEVEEAPVVFDHPDRLRVGDIFVTEAYRGTGLAAALMARAAECAREAGCGELTLDVDAGNERAAAFYEKVGFETLRRQLVVDVDDV